MQDADQKLANPAQLFVISGPSGVGKNTVAHALCQRGLATRAVTATTRHPREGEKDKVDYHFLSERTFSAWIEEGRFLEHTEYVGHRYGAPISSVNEAVLSGLPVILTIDVKGGLQIKEMSEDVTLIFLAAPSEEELKRRLRQRARGDDKSAQQRLNRARQERRYAKQYDFLVVNDDLDLALEEIAEIMSRRFPSGHNHS